MKNYNMFIDWWEIDEGIFLFAISNPLIIPYIIGLALGYILRFIYDKITPKRNFLK